MRSNPEQSPPALSSGCQSVSWDIDFSSTGVVSLLVNPALLVDPCRPGLCCPEFRRFHRFTKRDKNEQVGLEAKAGSVSSEAGSLCPYGAGAP